MNGSPAGDTGLVLVLFAGEELRPARHGKSSVYESAIQRHLNPK
jgi:hypothetical protein